MKEIETNFKIIKQSLQNLNNENLQFVKRINDFIQFKKDVQNENDKLFEKINEIFVDYVGDDRLLDSIDNDKGEM